MSGSKHFDKIAWAVTALMLVVTVFFMNGGTLGLEIMARTMGYENRLFDNTRVHTIDIVMDNWDEFIANAASEEYYSAAVVIDGEAYKNIGIRGKGNTSLSSVSSMNSDRYSFKVEFDHYDSSISYHGLDKLSLNNLIQDSTMMKDYLTYTLMNEFGAAAPLCSFAYITVNGEDWGLYLAAEGVEDSFLERNYGSDHGELYKPDSMNFGGGRGNGKNFSMDDFMNSEGATASTDKSEKNSSVPQMPDMGSFDPSQFQDGMPQMPGMNKDDSQNGGKPSFGDEKNDIGFSVDEKVLRSAFKKLELDEALLDGIDFENITMETVQSVLSALDEETMTELMQEVMGSVSFEMPDIGGFGGMGSSDVKLQYIDDNADSYTNIWNNAKTDITTADQTRLIEALKKLSDNEQLEATVDIEAVIRYFVVHNYVCNGDSYTGSMVHNYYLYEENGQLTMIPWDYNLAFGTFHSGNGQRTVNTPIDSPISGGTGEDRPMWNWILSDESYTELYHRYFAEFLSTVDIQAIINNAYSLIKNYVETDPTAFFTYEEFEAGVEALRQFCALRSESISMQLENGETVNDMSYADASALTLSDMGSMGGMGGFGGDKPGKEHSQSNNTHNSSADTAPAMPEANTDNSADTGIEQTAPSAPENKPHNDGKPAMPENFGGQMPDIGEMPEGFDPSQLPENFGGQMPDMGEMPEGFDPSQLPEGFGNMVSQN